MVPKPKPPLYSKKEQVLICDPSSVDDLLKMADEGLKTIDEELKPSAPVQQ